MKKLVSKVALRRKKQPELPAERITTDTLAQHREKVLAGGRKFKYPVQYQRHKLVMNAIIIGIAALLIVIAAGWYMLYQAQNTSNFMYRVTRVAPVPVATVDGKQVRYSEYLMRYRGAVHYLFDKEQVDIRSEDGKKRLEYVKSQAMGDAISDAYAEKLAHEMKISISDAEVETFLKQQKIIEGEELTEAAFNTVLEEYYGWSPGEYKESMRAKLLRQRVSYAIDSNAEALTKKVEAKVTSGTTELTKIADELNAVKSDTVSYVPPQWVPRTNQDGGLAETAGKLQKGQVSKAIKTPSGDGYYYVKLVDVSDSQVQYEYLHVPLTAFTEKLNTIKKENKIHIFIGVELLKN